MQLTHPKLQEFAVLAAWISVLDETAKELDELILQGGLPKVRQPELMP